MSRHLLPALVVLVAGCGVDEFFFTYHNLVPSQGCVVDASETLYRPRGVLDVSLGEGYVMFPLLQNQLPPRKAPRDRSDTAEPNMLTLTHYEVSVVPPPHISIDESLTRYSERTSGVLLPGDSRASSVLGIPDVIAQILRDESLVDEVGTEFLVEVTAVARTGLGGQLASQPFVYPVDVCLGCLTFDVGECPATLDELQLLAATYGNTCGRAQDEAIGCCTSGSESFCLSRPR